jgi:hypothetical protein
MKGNNPSPIPIAIWNNSTPIDTLNTFIIVSLSRIRQLK